jgi:pimeloyl-ACP methyl ester carboxylesterase
LLFAETPLLRIGYEEWNAGAPHTIVLLHGWPDAARGWHAVALRLAEAGYRVIAPALRGFAPTRFLHDDTPRSGQLSALGRDLVELLITLRVERPTLVGHDWGARAAANACGLEPGIAAHLVLLSVGYGTNDPAQPIPLMQARNYWYHWYLATDRGARTLRDDRVAFTRLLWDTWSPAGWYDDVEFAATAEAFAGDGWTAVTLHSYRHRWGYAAGDPRYATDESRLHPAPVLSVPTLVLHGAADACNHPDSSIGKERFFTGPYKRQLLDGVGHFPQREAPGSVAQCVLDFIADHPQPEERR